MKTFVLGLVVVAGIMSSCSPKAKEETKEEEKEGLLGKIASKLKGEK